MTNKIEEIKKIFEESNIKELFENSNTGIDKSNSFPKRIEKVLAENNESELLKVISEWNEIIQKAHKTDYHENIREFVRLSAEKYRKIKLFNLF